MEWGTAAAVAEAMQPNSESVCHEQSVCVIEREHKSNIFQGDKENKD